MNTQIEIPIHVSLQPTRKWFCRTMCRAASTDEHWPLADRSLFGFTRLWRNFAASDVLGEGGLRGIQVRKSRPTGAGFVTAGEVNPIFLTGTKAVECGTYLLPEWRGQGLNLVVKQQLLEWVFDAFRPDNALFVIPLKNEIALRAMHKLPWTVESTRTNPSSEFTRYLQRREWELGTSCELFSLAREQSRSKRNSSN